MTLMLHAGAEAVTFSALRELQTPDATETHVPIPHHRVVEMLRHTLGFYGHEVTEEHHGITKDGMRYFGLLSLKSTYGGYEDTVGIRNSHDKAFPIGIAFGSRVFVCDNMAFVADHVVKRKHTLNAKRDLPALVGEIVEPLGAKRELQAKTFELYRATALLDRIADQAIMQMYRQDIINVQRISEVLKQWETPEHDWGNKTAWRLFNSVTFALTGKVAENPGATSKLHQVIDGVCERVN